MSRQLGRISITLTSDENGALVAKGNQIQYTTRDTTEKTLQEAAREPLEDIVGTDTLDAWWAKVQAQIKKKHGIA